MKNKFKKIRSWAKKRDLYKKGDVKTQFLKLQEEIGELAEALLNKDEIEIQDAIGDIVVVLTNFVPNLPRADVIIPSGENFL